jgi:hypothetical protein
MTTDRAPAESASNARLQFVAVGSAEATAR